MNVPPPLAQDPFHNPEHASVTRDVPGSGIGGLRVRRWIGTEGDKLTRLATSGVDELEAKGRLNIRTHFRYMVQQGMLVREGLEGQDPTLNWNVECSMDRGERGRDEDAIEVLFHLVQAPSASEENANHPPNATLELLQRSAYPGSREVLPLEPGEEMGAKPLAIAKFQKGLRTSWTGQKLGGSSMVKLTPLESSVHVYVKVKVVFFTKGKTHTEEWTEHFYFYTMQQLHDTSHSVRAPDGNERSLGHRATSQPLRALAMYHNREGFDRFTPIDRNASHRISSSSIFRSASRAI
ncbi:hypothetical protein T439DRAFT_352532 [Meredithblackwellia eburnea MCA 4105]